MKVKKQATIWHALIVIIFLIVTLAVAIRVYGADPHIPLIASTILAAGIAVTMLGFEWSEIEEGMIDTIKMAMQAVLILMVIGTIVGTWILSGTVPTMIYYGLQILSPGIFLFAACLICCIVSLATGSSWTTAATVGIALIGVGTGLGIPVGMVAGAIISGAYFGDKMSPLSDTTNLAPAMAGTTLFEHVRHMIYTTVPVLVISLILYAILGLRYAGRELDIVQIDLILSTISANFDISLLLLIPPILVIVIVVLKIPAIPGLIGGTILGGIFAALFQGAGMGAIIDAAHYGYVLDSGVPIVDDLLSKGGLDGMMWTVSLILIALAFGGVMEKTGMLHAVVNSMLKFAKGTGSLVLATVVSSIAVNILAGEQYLSIVIPGRMYKDAYAEKGIHPKVLSRALEGSGTVTSALIPWNTCGVYMYETLGVHPFTYLPYAFLNLLLPIVNVIYAYLGITIPTIEKEKATA
ncbi:Na+/H+ antiporter NhaC [Alkaliphilus serpentinus]|uniref:Na+/H+ antiporter NhaC n=1 Tax=Alkaliphilus serpentinus TaxID=1482731 RepID=A0A833HQZ4_9FIRM|nr:Na+/H+ antiporter NhaC [Alkaliphilus serpentinus]KAB3532523.1 Na+/H+ antiporter NhaC [Alkaliphilus serpentinus]